MATRAQVFGIRIEPVLSYVDREKVDGRFQDAMKGHDHIVVYGSSKQGKTSLRQTYIHDDECVIVRCGPRMSFFNITVRQSGAAFVFILARTRPSSIEPVGGGVF